MDVVREREVERMKKRVVRCCILMEICLGTVMVLGSAGGNVFLVGWV